MNLHWSVDYDYHHNGVFSFGSAMEEHLRRCRELRFPTQYVSSQKRFTILPNYWGGFSTHKTGYENAGSVAIGREKRGDGWLVSGSLHNTDSCERYAFSYEEKEGLTGRFRCRVENLHGDLFHSLGYQGELRGGTLWVSTEGGARLVGPVAVDQTVYPDWSLLDMLPSAGPFAVLEHLESYYPGQTLQPLEDHTFGDLPLRGYVLAGYGQPMAYFWANRQGHVLIAAYTLMTYVLRDAVFEEVGL